MCNIKKYVVSREEFFVEKPLNSGQNYPIRGVLKNSKIKDQNVFIEAFYQNKKLETNSTIDYNQSLEINVISEYFGYNRSGLFYKLNGLDTFQPIQNGNLILNNLSSGNQKLEIF